MNEHVPLGEPDDDQSCRIKVTQLTSALLSIGSRDAPVLSDEGRTFDINFDVLAVKREKENLVFYGNNRSEEYRRLFRVTVKARDFFSASDVIDAQVATFKQLKPFSLNVQP